MEHAPPPRPPRFESPEAPPRGERSGFFDRLRRKNKQSEQAPPPPENAEASGENEPASRTRRQRFGESIAGLLFGKTAKSEAPQTDESTPPAGDRQPRPASTEAEPLIDRAARVRRFARNVLRTVLGTAREEREHGRAWDGGQEPLTTEPLVDAADDLRDAVHDLDDAAEDHGGYAGSGGDGPRVDRGAEQSSFMAQATERVTRRLVKLEKLTQGSAERNEAKRAVLATGLGVIAVAGVILIGHEYLAHKKIRKDQKTLRQVQAEQAAEIILQKQQLDEMTRRERAAHYERLSRLTHQQADVTREVAHDLRQETEMLNVIRGTHIEQDVPSWRAARAPEVVAARPESDIAPLSTVEISDTVEHGPAAPSGTGRQLGRHAGIAGGQMADDADLDEQLRRKVPLSPAVQRALALRNARAQRLAANAWLYGTLAITGAVVVVITFLLIG